VCDITILTQAQSPLWDSNKAVCFALVVVMSLRKLLLVHFLEEGGSRTCRLFFSATNSPFEMIQRERDELN